VARDRRRAKQRRERQARSGDASAPRADRDALPRDEAPELASGEVDVAEAQVALGRPELADDAAAAAPSGGSGAGDLIAAARTDDGGPTVPDRGASAAGGGRGGGDAPVATAGARAPEPRQRREGTRFGNFLRGSWRELQRVQWPDRRQVAQATAVVVGFVLISGGFLGLADWISARIVDLIV